MPPPDAQLHLGNGGEDPARNPHPAAAAALDAEQLDEQPNNRTTEEVVADLQTRANLAILEVAGVVLGNPEMGKVILRHC